MWHLFSRWMEHIKFPHFIKKCIRVKSPIIAICLLPTPRPITYCHTFFFFWWWIFITRQPKKKEKFIHLLHKQTHNPSWNSLFQVFVSLVFSHLFKIIASLLFNLFNALCNHLHMHILSYSFWNQHCDLYQFQFVPWWPMLSHCCTSS